MNLKGINFNEKFSLFDQLWTPKCVARFDNYLVKVGKIMGDYVWHSHAGCDEVFIVHKGAMRIDFKDSAVELSAGDMYIVEKGIEHKPFAQELCEIIMLERNDVINTGDSVNELTVKEPDWI